jgi:hypothetical protein
MKFLSKLGAIISKVNPVLGIASGIVAGFLPQDKRGKVENVTATISNDLSVLAGVITSVEGVGQALGIKGPDKLKAAAPLVAQAILSTALLSRHKIANEALFQQAATKIADGMADLLNSLDADGVDEEKAA